MNRKFIGINSLNDLIKIAEEYEDISPNEVVQDKGEAFPVPENFSDEEFLRKYEDKNVLLLNQHEYEYFLHPSTYPEKEWQITIYKNGKHYDHVFFDTKQEAVHYILSSKKGLFVKDAAYFEEFDRIKMAQRVNG